MPTSGIVKGFELKKNRDAEKKTIILQVELSDFDDVQSVELINAAGQDYNPPNGSQVIVLDLGNAWKVAIASDDGVESEADPGDHEIYSTDAAGETKIAFVKCTRNGALPITKINGDADFAVRFNELKTAFDQLLADHDAHTHNVPITGPAGTTASTPPLVGSTADIDPAKVDDLKLTGAP